MDDSSNSDLLKELRKNNALLRKQNKLLLLVGMATGTEIEPDLKMSAQQALENLYRKSRNGEEEE